MAKQSRHIERVCSSCFEDADLRRWIRARSGPRGCDACGGFDSPTLPIGTVADRIAEGLRKLYGFAVEQLPYESAEGGYMGKTLTTFEVLDEIDFSLPRDDGELLQALLSALPNELWCDYDWLALDDDEVLRLSWKKFCTVVKHERRFFFHDKGARPDDHDARSAVELLKAIGSLSDELGLIKIMPRGGRLYRARPLEEVRSRAIAIDFGPPPKDKALQSNRMNPPGIPMMYAALRPLTAKREIRAKSAAVGCWRLLRDARLLDLTCDPHPGWIFSEAERRQILGANFLSEFRRAIAEPVARDERVHVDYIPSQVVTEYLREHDFDGGPIDGVRYPSVVDEKGVNVALFVEESALCVDVQPNVRVGPWLFFEGACRR